MAEANRRGPGYGVAADGLGGYKVIVVDQNAVREASLAQTSPVAAPAAVPSMFDVQGTINSLPGNQPAPLTVQQRLAGAQGVGRGGIAPIAATRAPVTGTLASSRLPSSVGFSAGTPGTPGGPTPEEMGPAEVDRSRIDALLGNVSKANSGLMGLAESDRQFSAARAQLAQGLDQTQRQGIALARSGNRRDSAGMQARAIQTGAELGAQTTQQAAALRAQEEEADRNIRLNAYKAAGDLGLNASALEVDVNRLNMGAATDYLNQLFQRGNLQLQLDEQEAARVTNFIRDMALISKDYYSLDLAERQAVRDDLTRRYGIDQTTNTAFAQLDAQPGFWEKAALGLIGGAGEQATKAAFSTIVPQSAAVKGA